MEVRHTGVVTGVGVFRLRIRGRRSTRLVWEEDLRFPWPLGGPLTAALAAPVLRRMWRKNLDALKRQIERDRRLS